jgi:hypothetical protein
MRQISRYCRYSTKSVKRNALKKKFQKTFTKIFVSAFPRGYGCFLEYYPVWKQEWWLYSDLQYISHVKLFILI